MIIKRKDAIKWSTATGKSESSGEQNEKGIKNLKRLETEYREMKGNSNEKIMRTS